MTDDLRSLSWDALLTRCERYKSERDDLACAVLLAVDRLEYIDEQTKVLSAREVLRNAKEKFLGRPANPG